MKRRPVIASIFTIERGLMPLLDIAILLLGLFLVLLAIESAKERDGQSVLAGKAVVLLEIQADAERGWLISRVDSDSGRLSGIPQELDRADDLVRQEMALRQEGADEPERELLVVIQFPDPFAASSWDAADGRALEDALAAHRWVMVWGR